MNIQSHIHDIISESMREEDEAGASQRQDITEQELLQVLRERGVVDDIMKNLQFERMQRSGEVPQQMPGMRSEEQRPATHFVDQQSKLAVPLKKANIDPTRRYLYMQVLGGKAFLEHLQEPEPLPGQTLSTFIIHVHFRGQRFRSRPVPCACDPDFQEGFLLELHKEKGGDAARMADSTSMLTICDPVHLVLIKTDPSGDTTLVSSHHLEWRTVLATDNSRQNLPVELMGVGGESKVPVGLLEMRLEILPKPAQSLTEEVISTQIGLERNRTAERERLFLVYAKQWWREFLQIRPTHQNRLVKIFAQDENATNRPVCAFVRPLRGGRLLDTPRQAARFVSVIGYERAPAVGGGQPRELWSSTHAFLSKNKGDCEDHAVLLCSLLQGFGLNAFVCVGTKAKGAAHSWVMTLATDGLVTFWESLTGHRYIHQPINPDDPPIVEQPIPQYPYRTVGCVFNHQCFYANSQPSDNVDLCRFDFHDESLWKAMSIDAIESVCGPRNLGADLKPIVTDNTELIIGQSPWELRNQKQLVPTWPNLPPLVPSIYDSALMSNELELQIRALVVDHRKDLGLTTVWDDELSYLLTPALAAYELERTTGVSAGNEEFQQAIRRAVPDGHTFKGFPIQFIHHNARRAFATSLRSAVCEEIVCCRGDHVRLAVRVKVFTYPESACAVWIMFACKYRSVL